MMTIKEFAALCACNAQTLRYYDKIDLLKPVKVDPWSGYRYYEGSQALNFVKIKNLQSADFSIDEIKKLLTLSDQQVYEAFSAKIARQEQKLERIKEIQRSYLTEMNNMKTMIHCLCNYLLDKTEDQECIRDFGLTPDDIPRLVEALRNNMLSRLENNPNEPQEVTLVVNDREFVGEQAIENLTFLLKGEDLSGTVLLNADHVGKEEVLKPEDEESVWEIHGWEYVHEFISKIPRLDPDREYNLLFHLRERTNRGNIAFPMFMLGAMALRGYGPEYTVHCTVESAKDGQNHFYLMQKK